MVDDNDNDWGEAMMVELMVMIDFYDNGGDDDDDDDDNDGDDDAMYIQCIGVLRSVYN